MKSFIASKTIWVNALTVALAVLTLYGVVPNQELAEQVTSSSPLWLPLVNIALRFVTSKAIR